MVLPSGKSIDYHGNWAVLMLSTSRARQLKRKTNEWGFVKNIPAKEMAKMVRARQRRQIELGRPTKFLRHPGAGGFQVIPAAKLDAYQKRHGVPSDSGMSQSSGLSPGSLEFP